VRHLRILWKMVLVVTVCVSVCLTGCGGVQTIIVPTGEPVRLRQTVKRAKVWVADKDGVEIPGEIDLPEGWWCLPDPGE